MPARAAKQKTTWGSWPLFDVRSRKRPEFPSGGSRASEDWAAKVLLER